MPVVQSRELSAGYRGDLSRLRTLATLARLDVDEEETRSGRVQVLGRERRLARPLRGRYRLYNFALRRAGPLRCALMQTRRGDRLQVE